MKSKSTREGGGASQRGLEGVLWDPSIGSSSCAGGGYDPPEVH